MTPGKKKCNDLELLSQENNPANNPMLGSFLLKEKTAWDRWHAFTR